MSMITVVCGPPAGGKTTYVNEHQQAGDIVIDMDALCVALGSPDPHEHPAPIKRVAGSARVSAIRKVIDLHLDAWVIDTWLRTQTLRDHPETRYVLLDPGQTVTLQRAERDGRPDAALDAIRRWYLNPPALPHTATSPGGSEPHAADLGADIIDWW